MRKKREKPAHVPARSQGSSEVGTRTQARRRRDRESKTYGRVSFFPPSLFSKRVWEDFKIEIETV